VLPRGEVGVVHVFMWYLVVSWMYRRSEVREGGRKAAKARRRYFYGDATRACHSVWSVGCLVVAVVAAVMLLLLVVVVVVEGGGVQGMVLRWCVGALVRWCVGDW